MDYLFKFEGRLRRSKYFAGLVFLLVATFVSAVLVGFANNSNSDGALPLIVIISVAATVLQLNLSARRFNDMGWSGWSILLLIIPLVNVVLLLMLFFMKGSIGPNKYGEDPTVRPMIDDLSDNDSLSGRTTNIQTSSPENRQSAQARLLQEETRYLRDYHTGNSSVTVKPINSKVESGAPGATNSNEDNSSSVLGYVVLLCIILLVGAFLFFESFKTEDEKIAEMNKGVELFNDEMYAESFALLSQYADEGFFTDEASYCLGYMYGEGKGTTEDDFTANQIMLDLSDWEDSDYSLWADHYMGYQYYNGEGVEADTEEAYNRFIKAARGELPNAMLIVAQMYETGDGTQKDLAKAEYWYKKAAEQGIAEASEALQGSSFKSRKVSHVSNHTPDYSSSDFSSTADYNNGQVVRVISRCSLWINTAETEEIRRVSEGEYIEIVNTDTGNPSYYFVKAGSKHGYINISNISTEDY